MKINEMSGGEVDAAAQKRFFSHIDECSFCSQFIRIAWHNGKPKKYLAGLDWRKCETVKILVDEFDVPPDVSQATW